MYMIPRDAVAEVGAGLDAWILDLDCDGKVVTPWFSADMETVWVLAEGTTFLCGKCKAKDTPNCPVTKVERKNREDNTD